MQQITIKVYIYGIMPSNDKQQYKDVNINTCSVNTIRGVAYRQKEVNRLLQVEFEDLLARVE